MTLYVGEGLRGSNGAHSTLERISVTPCATHNQIGPLWCWFPSGWACAHSRPLWVSPTTSPVRLGVSPAAAPTPTGTFNQRSEALFSIRGLDPWVTGLLRSPPFVLVYLCANVGPRGATCLSACPVLRHSESSPLGLSVGMWGRRACWWSDCLPRSSHTPPVSVCHGHSSPLCPGCPSPPLLLVWINVYFLSPWCWTPLPFDFLSVLVV